MLTSRTSERHSTMLLNRPSARTHVNAVAVALLAALSVLAASGVASAQALVGQNDGGGWVQTPEGLAPGSCVHVIPNGAMVNEDGTVSLDAVRADGSTNFAGQIVSYPACTENWAPV